MRAINRSLEAQFRSLLEEDRKTRAIALTRVKKINLTHYAKRLGCFHQTLQQFSGLIDEFESSLSLTAFDAKRAACRERAAQGMQGANLKRLLDADVAVNRLVTSRGGKISRAHYADKLGVSRSYMAFFISIFEVYEERLGVTTGPEGKLDEMREWISTAFASRELALRDGKVDRKAFQAHFQLKGGTFLTRSSKIRELFEEFDARVKSEGYLPKVDDEELDRVVADLLSAPELNRDHLTINRVALAKRLGIPLPRLKREVVDRVIRRREAEILRQAEESVIDPFVQGRVFVFSELQGPWSRRFLENVGEAFKLYASGQVESKQVYLKLFDALAWIGADTSNHSAAAVAEANASGRICDLDTWEEALHSYRDRLISGIAARSASKSGVDGTIKALRRGLAALEAKQVVPRLSAKLRGVKFARRLTRHVPSVAEVGTRSSSDSAVRKEIETRLDELSGLLVDDWEAGDLPAFVEALEAEIQLVGELPDDPVEAIKRALERRLDALNLAASELVEVGMRQHKRGRALVANAKHESKAFLTDYFSANLSQSEKRELLRAAFPDSSTGETALANLLSMVETEFSGIPPRGQNKKFGQFFAKRYLELGGRDAINRLLFPDHDAVCAALVLYLLDSGSNVAVGRTLDRDCLETTDIEDHKQITGIKARADGKPIYKTLPIDSPSVKAINWLVSAGTALKRVSGKDSDRLFLILRGDRAEMLTEHAFRDWFGRFSRTIDGLAGLALTPRMIRPSILLRAALANEGRIAVGMAIGQHGADVSSSYQAKWATRRLYDVQVRRYQGDLETLIIVNAADVASKLGISAEDMRGRLASLRESGLGTFCKNHLGRPGAEGRACPTMDCWNDCPQLLIVAEVEAIASLQIWQASLRAVQPIWERDRPERWDQVWLPWLVLTDVVEEKMARGLISVWEAARRHVEMVTSAPGFVAPQPW